MRDSSIGIMPPLESELNQSINDMIKDDREIGAFRVEGYYEDIDFPQQIIHANIKYYEQLSSNLKKTIIEEGGYISDKARVKAPVYVGKNSYIGDNVIINNPLFVSENTRIDNGAIIEGGIIGNNTLIENYCYIRAVIGNHAKIGHGAEVFGVFLIRSILYITPKQLVLQVKIQILVQLRLLVHGDSIARNN